MERKEEEQFPESVHAATGMTVRIGQIYSAYVSQLSNFRLCQDFVYAQEI